MIEFAIPVKRGSSLFCSIDEGWEQVMSRQLRCGQKYKVKMRRKIGVIKEQREDLEATLRDLLE